MLIYQHMNSIGTNYFESILYENYCFVAHLHRRYEAAWLLEGELMLTVDGREHLLHAGDAALILPDQIHAYHSADHSLVWVFVFSSDLIPDANALLTGHTLSSCVFHPDRALTDYALPRLAGVQAASLGIRACLTALCADCIEGSSLLPRPEQETSSPAHRLLQYTSLHFRENVTLRSAAELLGYDASYLSRCFHRMTGMNFRQFLNACRIDYALSLIRSGSVSMTDAALESGFQSVRTFNRAFIEHTGRAPTGQP